MHKRLVIILEVCAGELTHGPRPLKSQAARLQFLRDPTLAYAETKFVTRGLIFSLLHTTSTTTPLAPIIGG